MLAAIKQAGRSEFFMVGGAGSANAMRAIQADNTVLKATVTYSPTMASSAVALARLVAQGKGMSDLVEKEVPASITLASATITKENVDAVPAARLRVLMGAPERSARRRHGGLRLHGRGPLPGLADRRPVLRPAAAARTWPCSAGATPTAAGAAARAAGLAVGRDRLAGSCSTRDDVELVDICTPGDTHAEIAIAALDAGKHVLCEKPLANTVDEARAMVAAAERAAGRRACAAWSASTTGGCPRWRWPGGWSSRAGSARSGTCARSTCRTGSSTRSSRWSGGCRRSKAGSGALGDIGAHIVDMAQFVTGDLLTGVSALTETFVKERPLPAASSGLVGVGGRRRARAR